MNKKFIIITIIVSIVLISAISILQFVYYRAELKKQTEIAFLKGQTETLLENNQKNVNDVKKHLEEFKYKLEEYNEFINNIKETSDNVKKQMEDFNNRLYSVDNAFTELYSIWTNSAN